MGTLAGLALEVIGRLELHPAISRRLHDGSRERMFAVGLDGGRESQQVSFVDPVDLRCNRHHAGPSFGQGPGLVH